MNVLPFSFVKQCRNAQHCATLSHQCKCYDPTKWPLSNAECNHFLRKSIIKQYLADRCHVDVVNRLKSLREQHVEYVAHLAKIKNEVGVHLVLYNFFLISKFSFLFMTEMVHELMLKTRKVCIFYYKHF